MSKKIIVNSNKGPYSTSFINSAIDELNENPIKNSIYLIDRKICDLYEDRINNILSSQRVIKIDANEVCLRLPESKGDFLTKRWTPVSVRSQP